MESGACQADGRVEWTGILATVQGSERPLMKRTSVTTLTSVGSVDLFIHLLPLCCSLGTYWGQTRALSLEFGVW